MKTKDNATPHNHSTPRPWKLERLFQVFDGKTMPKPFEIVCGEGKAILQVWGSDEEAKANAELIVRAVNAHEGLVELAQDLREYFADCADADSTGDPLSFKPNKEMTILDKIEQALKKAEAL